MSYLTGQYAFVWWLVLSLILLWRASWEGRMWYVLAMWMLHRSLP